MGLYEEGAGSAWLFSVVQVQLGAGRSLRCSDDPMDCSPTRLLSPWGFPGKNTAVGCHFLSEAPGKPLWTVGSNTHLLH